jgi:probable F420-dependent oxidoreductase
VCLVPQREPIATAKALASLDALSHGRVLFGVGVGWIPEEVANHGIHPPTRWAVMDERVQAMRAIWTQEEAEFHGRHVDFGPIWSWPKPAQRPHPPILVGGAGKGVIRRVLAYGDEWMPHAGMPAEQLRDRIRELQDAARAAGRGAGIPVTVFGADPDVRALEELRGIGVTRAVLYAPSADADQVSRFLDDMAPLVDAT